MGLATAARGEAQDSRETAQHVQRAMGSAAASVRSLFLLQQFLYADEYSDLSGSFCLRATCLRGNPEEL